MIPRQMEAYLRQQLSEETWNNRLTIEDGMAHMTFSVVDVDQLARLQIEVDKLGPRLVACMWEVDSPLEIGGYLVVDNLAMGSPSMGGIRMLPDLTPAAVHNLARGMTLKNAAANLPYGGGKSGIVAPRGLTAADRNQIVRGFARLLRRYTDIYLPGPDVGTNDEDMRRVAISNGLDHALSKPADMGGNRIDELGAAGGGCIIALQALLEELPRLKVLPQFADLQLPAAEEVSVLLQGFGAVGAHAARVLHARLPDAQVVGLSDALGCLFSQQGLPAIELFQRWLEQGLVTRSFYDEQLAGAEEAVAKYSTDPNDLLRESAFCLIPAAPVANYLDTTDRTHPSITVDRMGRWKLIIEGANTYSPDPARKNARARMEREVYRRRGVFIATDYMVNSGGVIYAAQEHLIKTPDHLRIPQAILGDAEGVAAWLEQHAADFEALAADRRRAAREYREDVIRRNMKEMVDLLISDEDMLPCEAAEQISVRRIARSESQRTARDVMEPIPVTSASSSLRQAAGVLIQSPSSIMAVVAEDETLLGVLTEWDITCATANGAPADSLVGEVMTSEVISADPGDGILDLLRKLEYHGISAMPVIEDGQVCGMVSAGLLARRSLLRLLQSELG